MNDIYRITLSDGTIINDLKLNGNNYVSEKEITADMFTGKLSKIAIENITNKTSEELEYMELVQIAKYEDGYYFVLRELTQDELDKRKMMANIDYISMMTDIEL